MGRIEEKPTSGDGILLGNPEAPTGIVVVPPPPDGGLRAWLQILGAHLMVFNSWYVIVKQDYIYMSRRKKILGSSLLERISISMNRQKGVCFANFFRLHIF